MSVTMQRPLRQLPQIHPGAAPTARPSIRLVPARSAKKRRPRFFYALVAFATVGGIIGAQLVLSVILSGGAYEIAGLQSKARELARTVQARTQDLDRLNSPQNLASNAEALGMVANNTPVYLRLSDGATLGEPVQASADAGVIAGADAMVSNSLLAGVPLVTDLEAEKARTEQLQSASTHSNNSSQSGTSSRTGAAPISPLTDGLPGVSTR